MTAIENNEDFIKLTSLTFPVRYISISEDKTSFQYAREQGIYARGSSIHELRNGETLTKEAQIISPFIKDVDKNEEHAR